MKNFALVPAVLAGICCAGQGYTKAYGADLAQMPIVGGQANATAVATSGTVPPGEVQYSKIATLRLLDKQTNRVDHLNFEAGKSQHWGALNVTMSKCAWGIGGVAVQDAAWLDVTAASGEPEFHGWMFNTFPSVATYDHPRYDVELEKCVRPAGYTNPAPARVAPPTPAGPEKEGGDDEAPTGAGGNTGVDTEFVVPGIPNGGATNAAPEAVPAAAAPVTPAPPAMPDQSQQPLAPEEPAPQPPAAPAEPVALPEPVQQPAGDQQQLQRMMDTPTTGQ